MQSLTFAQLVDLEQIRQLLEAHHKILGVTSAILDTEENVLIAVGWQDACTRFHRAHPEACQRCQESDAYIKAHLPELTDDYLDYRCKNGLRDVAVPINIAGRHLATLFVGQFFYEDERPDEEYFRAQARLFDFDEPGYLEAMRRVPVLKQKDVGHFMAFFRRVVHMLAETGHKNLKLAEEVQEREQAEAALRRSEAVLRSIFETIPDQLHMIDRDYRILHSNWRVWHQHFPEHRRHQNPHCYEVFFNSDKPCETCHVAEAFATGKAVYAEKLNPRIGYVDIRALPVFDESGTVVMVLEHIRDINEQKLQERALREAQSDLLAASRKAGMAEIASSVLHNVGNVLNSVNVSATLVENRVRESRAGGLGKAVRMIKEHAADLGVFIGSDEKGKLLPDYLSKLSEVLSGEQQEIMEELTRLKKSVDHIKEIVATQQMFTGAASIIEPVHVGELVTDALRMHADSLSRHQVTVVQEIGEMPELSLDKTRVLQILVNLISNAKQAVQGMSDEARRITLKAELRDEHLRVSVSDDGEGIAAENLARIFNHGFTTRKDGHGFGLHSCALAAKEMGGALTAGSDGPGRGATFTLELPRCTGEPVGR